MRKIFPSLIREGGYWQNGVELWSFIHSAVEEASAKEYQRGALMQVKLDAETVVSDRKQLEREIIKRVKRFTRKCPYMPVKDKEVYVEANMFLKDLLKKETNK